MAPLTTVPSLHPGGSSTPALVNSFDPSDVSNATHETLSAYFLGPQGENAGHLIYLLESLVTDNVATRRKYHPKDGEFISHKLQETQRFLKSRKKLEKEFAYVSRLLNKYCVPFYSPRYNGHIQWEPSIPSILGSLATTICNPNNVTFESSPFTTLVELEVGRQLCRLVGYNVDNDNADEIEEGKAVGWGHLVCGGTIANLESIWTTRNLKFYPLSIFDAMSPTGPLSFISETFRIRIPTSGSDTTTAHAGSIWTIKSTKSELLFRDLTPWQLLNLPSKTILSIPSRLIREYGISPSWLEENLSPYLIQTKGKEEMVHRYCTHSTRRVGNTDDFVEVISEPQYLIASTKHYSWPKGASLTGIGSAQMVNIPITPYSARLSITHLRIALDEHLRRKQAIYAVVVVVGSTEEGAVDPVEEVLEIREEYEKKGLCFLVHADAAWGGYFSTMIRTKDEMKSGPIFSDEADDSESEASSFPEDFPHEAHSRGLRSESATEHTDRDFVPTMALRDWTIRQLRALNGCDSITLDPHKSGYVPFPAGGLLYQDGRMKYLATWTAPYLAKGKNGESIGMYGVEGSKPGGPAVATYLQHRVIEPHMEGHGNLLGEVSFTCRRISAHWACLSDSSTHFIVVPFNPLPTSEPSPSSSSSSFTHDSSSTGAYKSFLRAHILPKSNAELVKDVRLYTSHQTPGGEERKTLMRHLSELGSDLNINVFACNFRIPRRMATKAGAEMVIWELNRDVDEANFLNRRIYERCSVTTRDKKPGDVELYLSMTVFKEEDYGECGTVYQRQLGLDPDTGKTGLVVLRNVVMSPLTAAGNFVHGVADIFRRILIEEMKHVVYRNTRTPLTHSFVIQGTTDRRNVYLDYLPSFYNVNTQHQVVLCIEIQSSTDWKAYVDAATRSPTETYILEIERVLIEDILVDERGVDSYRVSKIHGMGLFLPNVTITNIRIVKSRSLSSQRRSLHYPATNMPFYLYGSTAPTAERLSAATRSTASPYPPTNLHITHCLLRAPNAHLSASSISLSPSLLASLTTGESKLLESGVLLCLTDRREVTMQPFSSDHDIAAQSSTGGAENWPGAWFKTGAIFTVAVYRETRGGEWFLDGYTGEEVGKEEDKIGEGWMRIDGRVSIDVERLNQETFVPEDEHSPVVQMETAYGVKDGISAGGHKLSIDEAILEMNMAVKTEGILVY